MQLRIKKFSGLKNKMTLSLCLKNFCEIKRLSLLILFFMMISLHGGLVPSSYGDISQKNASLTKTGHIQHSYIVALQHPESGESTLTLHSAKSLMNSVFNNDDSDLSNLEMLSLTHEKIGKKNLSFAISRIDFLDKKRALEILTEEKEKGRILFFEPNRPQNLFVNESLNLNNEGTEESDDQSPWWRKQINYPFDLDLSDPPLPENEIPIIAILDSGIDSLHPQLKKALWQNKRPGNYGCLNDQYGCDVTKNIPNYLGTGNALPFRTSRPGETCPLSANGFLKGDCFHGTHVAGIIAGKSDGLCPSCKILNIKVVEDIDGVGKVLDSSVLKALEYIRRLSLEGGFTVRVVNSSYGSVFKSRAIGLVMKELQKNNILFVAAAGNENRDRRVYPAAYHDVIAVAAFTKSGKKALYSNFGSWIDILAPGGEQKSYYGISSTVPGGGYYESQGTSMAAPIISGVAGLLLRKQPTLSAQDLRTRILHAASPIVYSKNFAWGYNYNFFYRNIHSRGTRQPLLGFGLVDVNAALERAQKNDFKFEKEPVMPLCGEVRTKENHSLLVGFIFLMPLSFSFLMSKKNCPRRRKK